MNIQLKDEKPATDNAQDHARKHLLCAATEPEFKKRRPVVPAADPHARPPVIPAGDNAHHARLVIPSDAKDALDS